MGPLIETSKITLVFTSCISDVSTNLAQMRPPTSPVTSIFSSLLHKMWSTVIMVDGRLHMLFPRVSNIFTMPSSFPQENIEVCGPTVKDVMGSSISTDNSEI